MPSPSAAAPPRPRSRLRRLAPKLLLSAASLAAAVVGAELVARFREPGPFTLFDRNPYVDSAVDGHVRHRPGFVGRWDSTWYQIDARGLRGPGRTPTFATGELRIACVGDSCTFGKGVLDAETWPRVLEADLRAGGADVVAFNLGVNGAWGRVYRAMLAEHVAELRPQIVLVAYNLNDFPNAIRAVHERVFEERPLRRIVPQGLRDALGRMALYRWVRARFYERNRAEDWRAAEALAATAAAAPEDESVWRRQRDDLAALRELCAAHGARLLVFLFPYESQLYLDAYERGPVERLQGLCRELEVPFVDLTEGLRAAVRADPAGRRLFLPGDRFHPNAEGYRVVARTVLEALRALRWLPDP